MPSEEDKKRIFWNAVQEIFPVKEILKFLFFLEISTLGG
jgi:hypothetical protein